MITSAYKYKEEQNIFSSLLLNLFLKQPPSGEVKNVWYCVSTPPCPLDVLEAARA
jgi:hypothetical protein